MTKDELVAKVSERCNVTRSFAVSVIEQIIDIIINEVANGNDVVLRGFGTFKIKELNKSRSRIPTGEIVERQPHKAPRFFPGREFKRRVREKDDLN